MTSAVPIIIKLLKAAVPVAAVVADRIDPEIAKGTTLPRIVVRQSTGRGTYGLRGSTGLTEARCTILCGAATFTAADRLAGLVKAALSEVQAVPVLDCAVTLHQEGEDGTTFDKATGRDGADAWTRIVGYRVLIGAA